LKPIEAVSKVAVLEQQPLKIAVETARACQNKQGLGTASNFKG
jgi:hypothetical protein